MAISNEITRAGNPLDLYNLFVNEIAGGEFLFLIVGFAAIFLLSAKMRIPNKATVLLCLIFGLLMSAHFPSIMILVILTATVILSIVWSQFIGKT